MSDDRKSEEQHGHLMESSGDLIFYADRAGIFRMVGGGRLQEYGLRSVDIVGRLPEEFFSEEEVNRYRKRHRWVLENGMALTYEHTLDIGGVTRFHLSTLYPIKDKQGEVELVGAICRDITERKRAEEILKKRATQLATLGEVGRQITSLLELDLLLDRVVHVIHQAFDYRYVTILLVDPPTGELDAKAGAGYEVEAVRLSSPKVGEGSICGRVASSGEPLLVNDVSQEVSYRRVDVLADTCSELAVPIKVKGRLIGVLDVQSTELRAFGDDDLFTLQTLADEVGVAIENARLFDETRQQGRDLGLLYETGRLFASSLEATELLDQITLRCTEVVDTDLTLVRLVEDDWLVVRGSCFRDPAEREEVEGLLLAHPIRVGEAIAGRVASTGEAAIHRGEDVAGVTTPGYVEYLRSREWVVVPMRIGEVITGVLTLIRKSEKGPFRERDVALIQGIADQSAVAIENARLYEHARKEIAERGRTEKELKESEEKYRSLAENINVGVFRNTPEPYGRFIEVNPALVRMLGCVSREELLPRKVTDSYQHPEDRKKFDEKILKDGFVRNEELRLRKEDGTPITVSVSAVAVRDRDGEVRFYDGIIEDITERKRAEEALRESEERYHMIFDHSPLGIIHFDQDGVIIDCNDRFIEIIGSPREDLVGYNMLESMRDGEARLAVERALAEGAGQFEGGYEFAIGNKKATIKATYRRITSEHGNFLGAIGIIEDVTERKRLEAQLHHAEKMEAVGTLAGGIAHDFNNLLQAVEGYAELLLASMDRDETDCQRLQEIVRAAKRGGELTRQLLAFSSKMEPVSRLVDLNREVRQVKKLLERTIPKMIDIELTLAEGLWVISADPAHIEQVLVNLAINARDAMPEGGRLTVMTENVSLDEEYCASLTGVSPGDYVQLSVSDTGHGMDKEVVQHIFEPFYTTKQRGKGTGLGLAMVYGIVKGHGGQIMCQSEPGEGTTIKIHLPALAHGAFSEETAEEERPAGGNERILVVDDEPSLVRLAEEILTRFGYTVLTAASGEMALELYHQDKERIDLVILDLIMPGIGGKRFLEELLRMDPQAKVIISSGSSADEPARRGVEAGAKSTISKPYKAWQLLRVIRDVLDKV